MIRPVLREATSEDADGIAAVQSRNGMPIEPWAWLWQDNPALEGLPKPLAAGWVLEADGRVVGYLGNVARRYHLGGRQLLAAAARKFSVDEAYRSHSLKLMAAFLRQEGPDFLLNTSANPATAKILEALKMPRIPQADVDRSLFLVMNRRRFLAAALQRRGLGRSIAGLAAPLLAPALAAEAMLRGRGARRRGGGIRTFRANAQDIDGRFDDFWVRLLRERAGSLLADRSAKSIRWQFFSGPDAARRPSVIIAEKNGQWLGYAVDIKLDSPSLDLTRRYLVDLVALGDDNDVLDCLLAAVCEQARSEGTDLVEAVGFAAAERACLERARPYSRALPSWPYWYAPSPSCAEALAGTAWRMSAFDGDAGL